MTRAGVDESDGDLWVDPARAGVKKRSDNAANNAVGGAAIAAPSSSDRGVLDGPRASDARGKSNGSVKTGSVKNDDASLPVLNESVGPVAGYETIAGDSDDEEELNRRLAMVKRVKRERDNAAALSQVLDDENSVNLDDSMRELDDWGAIADIVDDENVVRAVASEALTGDDSSDLNPDGELVLLQEDVRRDDMDLSVITMVASEPGAGDNEDTGGTSDDAAGAGMVSVDPDASVDDILALMRGAESKSAVVGIIDDNDRDDGAVNSSDDGNGMNGKDESGDEDELDSHRSLAPGGDTIVNMVDDESTSVGITTGSGTHSIVDKNTNSAARKSVDNAVDKNDDSDVDGAARKSGDTNGDTAGNGDNVIITGVNARSGDARASRAPVLGSSLAVAGEQVVLPQASPQVLSSSTIPVIAGAGGGAPQVVFVDGWRAGNAGSSASNGLPPLDVRALVGNLEKRVGVNDSSPDGSSQDADGDNNGMQMPLINDAGKRGRNGRMDNGLVVSSDNTLIGPDDVGSEPFDVDNILSDAVDRRASDVHIMAGRPIKLRIDGTMYGFTKYHPLDESEMNAFITDPGNGVVTADNVGHFNQSKSSDVAYTIRSGAHMGERFRVHLAEEFHGAGFVFRHIRPEIFKPGEIGLTDDVMEWTRLSQGLVFVTGPTGSGKSATLATLIREIQLYRAVKIVTLEEPVETLFPLDGMADIWQKEIPENENVFENGVRDAMREDPDVMLIGEVRDVGTLKAAMQACNTGHLVFATIHASSAPDVITRVMDLSGDGVDRNQLKSDLARNLKGVLSQRLLLRRSGVGRIAVREIIHVDTPEQRELVLNEDAAMLSRNLRETGEDLDSRALLLALEGETSVDSARSVSSDRNGFDEMVSALSPAARRLLA